MISVSHSSSIRAIKHEHDGKNVHRYHNLFLYHSMSVMTITMFFGINICITACVISISHSMGIKATMPQIFHHTAWVSFQFYLHSYDTQVVWYRHHWDYCHDTDIIEHEYHSNKAIDWLWYWYDICSIQHAIKPSISVSYNMQYRRNNIYIFIKQHKYHSNNLNDHEVLVSWQ